jgi:hypothetical protein
MEKKQFVEIEIPDDIGGYMVATTKKLVSLGAHSVPESITIIKQEASGLLQTLRWTARVRPEGVRVGELMVVDEAGAMSPNFLSAVSISMWPDTFKCLSAVTGVAYEQLWEAHLETIEPREGKTKAQWIACLWRNHYEPQGFSMVDLANRLGLTHKSVLTYASRNDPTRKPK